MLAKTLGKWVNHIFSTGPYAGNDYTAFQKAAKADLKKQCKENGLALHAFYPNHYEFAAVLKNEETERFVYVSIRDVRVCNWRDSVMVRTMSHEKDWSGGHNHYCAWEGIGEYAASLL